MHYSWFDARSTQGYATQGSRANASPGTSARPLAAPSGMPRTTEPTPEAICGRRASAAAAAAQPAAASASDGGRSRRNTASASAAASAAARSPSPGSPLAPRPAGGAGRAASASPPTVQVARASRSGRRPAWRCVRPRSDVRGPRWEAGPHGAGCKRRRCCAAGRTPPPHPHLQAASQQPPSGPRRAGQRGRCQAAAGPPASARPPGGARSPPVAPGPLCWRAHSTPPRAPARPPRPARLVRQTGGGGPVRAPGAHLGGRAAAEPAALRKRGAAAPQGRGNAKASPSPPTSAQRRPRASPGARSAGGLAPMTTPAPDRGLVRSSTRSPTANLCCPPPPHRSPPPPPPELAAPGGGAAASGAAWRAAASSSLEDRWSACSSSWRRARGPGEGGRGRV